MIERQRYLIRLETATKRSPIVSILGPRQVGKTTLAKEFARGRDATFFDLESEPDRLRLVNPELALGDIEGLVVIDEIQMMPQLFQVLRVLVDRSDKVQYLILGSASPDIIRGVSETLAGRIEFIELTGFGLQEVGIDNWRRLWVRGGFPRSYLSSSDESSFAWRNAFIRTFVERDIPQLGISISASAMRRFWNLLAHYHGQYLNTSALARGMGVSVNTARHYLDILTGAMMVRQLQPWFVNLKKRQVRSPKIYLRDSGILHSLLNLETINGLLGHPAVGPSWGGFIVEETLKLLLPFDAYFWATHAGAELDLLFAHGGKQFGVEVKFSEAPKLTKSMHIALDDLGLTHLWVIHPGPHTYPMTKNISALSINDLLTLPQRVDEQSRT